MKIEFNKKKIARLKKSLGDAQLEIDILADEVINLNIIIRTKEAEIAKKNNTIRRYKKMNS